MNRRSELGGASANVDALGLELGLDVARLREIEWLHPRLTHLSDEARLIYACLVDGRSGAAQETLESVELVWTNHCDARMRYRDIASFRDALDEICLAVEELISSGLLILLDPRSIFHGWVMRPWEGSAS